MAEGKTHTESLFGEHNYAKAWKDDGPYGTESAMDTTPVANADDIIVNVTQLDKNHDTFESLLFELLKSRSGSSTGVNDAVITSESLATLSQDQIKDIGASSPAYYETIQHVVKMRNNTEFTPSPMSVDSMGLVSEISHHSVSIGPGGAAQPSLTNSTGSTISNVSSSSSGRLSLDSIKTSPQPTESSTSNPIVAVSSPGAKSPSISIKISPDQLKSLQSQLTDMFKQQNLHLPDDLSLEQKQMLLNSLIAQQLNATLQQWLPGASSTSTTAGSTQPHPQNVSTIASTSQGGGVASASSTKASSSDQQTRAIPTTTTATEKINKEHKAEEPTKKKKDSDSKRPPTAFNLFFSEMYPTVQEQQPNISFSDASKMVSGLWSGLGQDGKKKYYDKCEQIRSDFNSRSKQQQETPVQRIEDHPVSMSSTQHNNLSSEEAIIKSPTSIKSTSGKRSKITREKEEGMCLQDGCFNMAVSEDTRGTKYCSNECIVNHSKIMFHTWVTQRRVKTV